MDVIERFPRILVSRWSRVFGMHDHENVDGTSTVLCAEGFLTFLCRADGGCARPQRLRLSCLVHAGSNQLRGRTGVNASIQATNGRRGAAIGAEGKSSR